MGFHPEEGTIMHTESDVFDEQDIPPIARIKLRPCIVLEVTGFASDLKVVYFVVILQSSMDELSFL
jgi:hypothetical protein